MAKHTDVAKAVAGVAAAVLALDGVWPATDDDDGTVADHDRATVAISARLLDTLAGLLAPADHRSYLRGELKGRNR